MQVEQSTGQEKTIYQQAFEAVSLSSSELSQLVSASLPLNVDPTKANLAYGNRTIPKLISEMDSLKLVEKQRAITLLSGLFHNPLTISLAIKEQIIRILVSFLHSDDLTCKQKSVECLEIISRHGIGREAILDGNAISSMHSLLQDPNLFVRLRVSETFARLTATKHGVDQLMKSKLFPVLVSIVKTERIDIQENILKTLSNCIRSSDKGLMPKVAIECDGLKVFTELSESPSTPVVVAACECIMMLCFYHECKLAATNSSTISVLSKLSMHRKSEARAAACGALMTITINCEAKKWLVRQNVIDKLIMLLNDKNELVLLNALKTIENCAEDYRGRFQLGAAAPRIEELCRHANENVGAAARSALKVINWRP